MTSSKQKLVGELSEGIRRMTALGVLISDLVAERVGLTSNDLECLDLIVLGGGKAAPGDLVKASGLTSGAITGVIDRLEAAGCVRRQPDDSDRRKFVLVPQPGRIAELSAYYAPVQEAMHDLWSTYTTQQLATLVDFTRRSSDATSAAVEKIRAMRPLPGSGSRRRRA